MKAMLSVKKVGQHCKCVRSFINDVTIEVHKMFIFYINHTNTEQVRNSNVHIGKV